jgi:hypothetical protein
VSLSSSALSSSLPPVFSVFASPDGSTAAESFVAHASHRLFKGLVMLGGLER